MIAMNETDLEALGLAAAKQVVGDDAVKQVQVHDTEDTSGQPTYYFSFAIDQDRSRERLGLIIPRVMQNLLDELGARGDEHRALVRVLSPDDWQKRNIARPY